MAARKPKKKSTKADEFPRSQRVMIRHAYNETITLAARLVSFAACPPLPDWDAIEDRQEELATGDLIAFSLYLRRLIETVGIEQELRAMEMPAFEVGGPKRLPIVRVINTVIHHRWIHIVRRKSDTMQVDFKDQASYAAWSAARKEGFYPIITVKSDRGSLIAFRVDLMIGAVNDQILDRVIEYCDERLLFLEDPLK